MVGRDEALELAIDLFVAVVVYGDDADRRGEEDGPGREGCLGISLNIASLSSSSSSDDPIRVSVAVSIFFFWPSPA